MGPKTLGVALRGQTLLVNAAYVQGQLRLAMNYYELMAWVLSGTLLLVALFLYLSRKGVYVKFQRLPPA